MTYEFSRGGFFVVILSITKDLKMFRCAQHDGFVVPLWEGGSPKDRGIDWYLDYGDQILRLLRATSFE